MRSEVQILSVKKNTINVRVRSSKQVFLMPICLAFTTIFMLCFSFGGTSIRQVGGRMAYIYNPVNSLYSDNSSIVFASVFIDKESLDFVLPMSGGKVELKDNGDIVIVVNNSIMVKSSESGVVEEVGVSLDGVKYIKIKHCLDVQSVIENVDIIGVQEGEIVKKGQDIATAVEGQKIVMKLYVQDVKLTNIELNQSKIVWES